MAPEVPLRKGAVNVKHFRGRYDEELLESSAAEIDEELDRRIANEQNDQSNADHWNEEVIGGFFTEEEDQGNEEVVRGMFIEDIDQRNKDRNEVVIGHPVQADKGKSVLQPEEVPEDAPNVGDGEDESDGFEGTDIDLSDDIDEEVDDADEIPRSEAGATFDEPGEIRSITPARGSPDRSDRGRTSRAAAGGRSRGRAAGRTRRTSPEHDQNEEDNLEDEQYHDSDDLHSVHSSDDEGSTRRWPEYHAQPRMVSPTFEIGMLFGTMNELRTGIRQYAILNKVNVDFKINRKDRLTAECMNCHWWMLMASINKKEKAIQVKKFKDEHTCGKEMPEKFITHKMLGDGYLEHLRADPTWSSKSFSHQIDVDSKLVVDKSKIWRAKRYALNLLKKDEDKQYAKLWDYAEEVKRTNDGSTVFICCDHLIFQRMYVCLDACKKGFLQGCRPLIGLDGCWLKGKYGGQILAAVGMDANDCIYPIAYSVVEVESTDSWAWFIHNLGNDLNIDNSYPWTFMADKEKGLMNALDNLMPYAEKRYCVRHLWKNMCRVPTLKKGKELRDMLWRAAGASYPAEFKRCMEQLKVRDKDAWEWLSSKPPEQWSKSHFREFPKCDTLLNNLSECFNRYILDARDQPILTMLEMIRCKIMRRMCLKRKVIEKYQEATCPKILKKLEKLKAATGYCIAQEATANIFNVSIAEKFYVVDLLKHTCSCRRWQLSGIPCIHSISCILKEKKKPQDFIHACYSVDMMRASYAPVIYPIRDMEDYEETNKDPIKPPPLRVKKGRPPKVRRKGPDETLPKVSSQGVKKISLKGTMSMTCTNCGETGHNKRTCGRRASQPAAECEAHAAASESTPGSASQLQTTTQSQAAAASASQEPGGSASQAQATSQSQAAASASQTLTIVASRQMSTEDTQVRSGGWRSSFISSMFQQSSPNAPPTTPSTSTTPSAPASSTTQAPNFTSAFLKRWQTQEAASGSTGAVKRANDVAAFLSQQQARTKKRRNGGPSSQPPSTGT